jgi:hypothetical protein
MDHFSKILKISPFWRYCVYSWRNTLMHIIYDAAAKPGHQYTIVVDGHAHPQLSRNDAEGALRGAGYSVRQAMAAIAKAKINGTTVAPQ